MKKNTILTIIIVVLLLIIIGGGIAIYLNQKQDKGSESTDVTVDTPSEGYQSEDFSIKPPENWERISIPNTLVGFRNTDETFSEGSPENKINFQSYMAVSFDNAQGRTFSEFVDFIKEEVQKMVPSFNSTNQFEKQIDGKRTEFIEAEMVQQDVNYKVLMVVVDAGDKYYLVSFNTTAGKWDHYKDLFYLTAESFRLISSSGNVSSPNQESSPVTEDTNELPVAEGDSASYVMTPAGTKHFMLDLVNGRFGYERVVVKPGDSVQITLMENGFPVEFTFPSTGQVSEKGTFSTEIPIDAASFEEPITCLNRDCGTLLFIIAGE